MATANAYQTYKTQDISMASPMALIVMLYNGCIKRLKLARMAIEKKDFEDANTQLKKARDIISELINSLDFNYPIANDLMALYEFMLREIIQINITKDKERIEPVINMLSGLRDTWKQVEKTCRQSYPIEESQA